MTSQTKYQQIITKLALKYDISERNVEEIVQSQFRLVDEIIRNNDTRGIRLKHFGSFEIPTRLKNKK